MLKKSLVLLSLLIIVSGCKATTINSNYDKTVEFALDSKIGNPNYSGGSYTFYLPTNSTVLSTQQYSSTILNSRVSYTINVNVAEYLISKGKISKTTNGDYVVINEENINEDIAQYAGAVFYTRRILFDNEYAASPEENKKTATAVLNQLNSSSYSSGSNEFLKLFGDLALKHSHDERSKNNEGKLKGLTVSEMSTEYFEVVTTLEPKSYTKELVETEDGFQIVYLESIVNEEIINIDFETIIDDSNIYYSFEDESISLYVISYDNVYNVIAINDYSTVSAVVTENKIDDAIFNTLVLLRGINVNDNIAIKNYVSDDIESKPKLINLNQENEELTQAIESTYSYKFSSSFSDGYSKNNYSQRNLYEFNSRELTAEEIKELEEKNNTEDNNESLE